MNRSLTTLLLCFVLALPVAGQSGPLPGGSMDYAGPFPPGLAPATGFLAKTTSHLVPADLSVSKNLSSTANCGTNIYYKKCKHCFIMVGPKTEEQCKEVAGLIEHNREVLERALCRLSEYEGVAGRRRSEIPRGPSGPDRAGQGKHSRDHQFGQHVFPRG